MPDTSPADPAAPLELRLRDLRPTEAPVIIVARVVAVERREVTRRSDGSRRPVLSGLLSDGTATVRFTWWDPPTEGVDRGTVLRAGPVQIREFRGRAEVSFGWRTRVEPASEAELPVVRPEELPLRRLADLSDGDEGLRLEVRVGRVQAKTVSVGQDRRLLHEGVVYDASGAVPFTAWSDFRLAVGDTIRILGAYVRSFRDRPQLVLDERAHVQRISDIAAPGVEEWRHPAPTAIGLVEAGGGAAHVAIAGVVVGLSPPSGIVHRCPTCGRGLSGGLCRTHGTVSGVADLRARLVLDDGTGAAVIDLDRAQAEAIGGRSLGEILDELRERPDPDRVTEDLHRRVFGHRYTVVGRATTDAFGVTVYPEEVRVGIAP